MQESGAPTHFIESYSDRAAFRRRQALKKGPVGPPEWQIVLTREPGEFDDVRPGAREVAADEFEHGCVHFPVCVRADMRDARDPPLSAFDEGSRAIDVAERPQCKCLVEHPADAGVVSEAERQIVVAAGLEQFERTLQMVARFNIFSGKPMSGPSNSTRNARLRGIGSRRDVARNPSA